MREIEVSKLQPATEIGTCNACDTQITENGTAPGAQVYEVRLLKLALRLCNQCASRLASKLHIRLGER